MDKKLSRIEISFSNGAVFYVPHWQVIALNFDKVSKSLVYNSYRSSSPIKYKIARVAQIELDNDANTLENMDENSRGDGNLPFSYLSKNKGSIIGVDLVYDNGKYEKFATLWVEPHADVNTNEKTSFDEDTTIITIKERKKKK